MLNLLFLVLLSLWPNISAVTPLSSPTIRLDNATMIGLTSGRTSKFLGIPFAKPPTGDLRYRLPQAIAPYTRSLFATSYGLSCPQQAIALPVLTGLAVEAVDYIANSIYSVVFPDSEDCLTVNVVKPARATSASKLPVIAWIYGGGFELGSTSMYDGSIIVERSIALDIPVVYVSMNYRLTGFGFMGGQEIKDAGVGNLGLQDQREALRWIQKYIGAFGGDPSKVTIWGESAGAISVSLQMVANNGNNEGLFRAGFMQSGSPIPVSDITNGQKYYDAIVSQTGCSGSPDTLACLRSVPYNSLKAAINKSPGIFSYQSLSLAWLPRPDGVFLADNPQRLVQQDKVADVPFITGDCDDEGTLFSLSTLNITTESELEGYLRDTLIPRATDFEIQTLLNLYTGDITEGSPFDSGILNAITPQFKRIAAFMGDAVFQAPRRFFLDHRSRKQDTWAFLSKRLKDLPVLGSVHTSDLLNVYGGGDMADYLIRFAAHLNPNTNLELNLHPQWPQYTAATRKLLTFYDGLVFNEGITEDRFRTAAMKALTDVTLKHPI